MASLSASGCQLATEGPQAEPASVARDGRARQCAGCWRPRPRAASAEPRDQRVHSDSSWRRGLPWRTLSRRSAALHDSQFCGVDCATGPLRMRVARQLTSRPGTAAGVVALHSQKTARSLWDRAITRDGGQLRIALDAGRASRTGWLVLAVTLGSPGSKPSCYCAVCRCFVWLHRTARRPCTHLCDRIAPNCRRHLRPCHLNQSALT